MENNRNTNSKKQGDMRSITIAVLLILVEILYLIDLYFPSQILPDSNYFFYLHILILATSFIFGLVCIKKQKSPRFAYLIVLYLSIFSFLLILPAIIYLLLIKWGNG